MASSIDAVTASGVGPQLMPSIDELRTSYLAGETSPAAVCTAALQRITAHRDRGRGDQGHPGQAVWISVVSEPDLLMRCAELEAHSPAERATLPLFGIPFAVKDSIDVAGFSTTLACPDYGYIATSTAPVVQRMLDAGAVLLGKNNLDQFATGLTGTRSPYGTPHSVYDSDLISGGSSSGSALAVALGDVTFAVATDTAGSGRVPPALNGVPGYKPSRGLISTVGLVPACRSLDCISLIAGSFDDIAVLLDVAAAPDRRDPWHRDRIHHDVDLASVRIGLPDLAELEFFSDEPMAAAHDAARTRIAGEFATRAIGLQPFLDAGSLLYQGPWVAERLLEFGDFLDTHPGAANVVVEGIIRSGAGFSAVDTFRAQYRLAELMGDAATTFEMVDVIVVPTIGTTFTIDEVLADPITTNTALGLYTHSGNLLDLCAAAVPAGRTGDGRPASCMVLGPALADDVVLAVAQRLSVLFPSDH